MLALRLPRVFARGALYLPYISPYPPISPLYLPRVLAQGALRSTPSPDPDPDPNHDPTPSPDHNLDSHPDQASFNVAVAGSLIMYDRLRKRTELARRLGGDVGGQSRLQAERTAPRLR